MLQHLKGHGSLAREKPRNLHKVLMCAGAVGVIASFAHAQSDSATGTNPVAAPYQSTIGALLESECDGRHTSSREGELGEFKLAANGRSVAYSINWPGNVPCTEVAWRSTTAGAAEHRFVISHASTSGPEAFDFSPSGRWLVFSGPGRSGVLDASTGAARLLPANSAFAFIRSSGKEGVLLTTGDTEHQSIEVRDLATLSTSVALTAVRAHALSPDRTRFAWSDEQGLHVYDQALQSATTIDADGRSSNYTYLAWNDDSTSIACIRSDGTRHDLVIARRLDTGRPETQIFTANNIMGWPARHVLSSQTLLTSFSEFPDAEASPLVWRADGDGIFVGLEEPPTEMAETPQNLAIWHWRDPMTPAQRAVAPPSRYVAFLDLNLRRLVPLADQALQEIAAQRRGQWVVELDPTPYLHDRMHPRADFYRVNLLTGQRDAIARSLITLQVTRPRVSPDGEFAVYQEQGDIVSVELTTGVKRNISARARAQFYHPDSNRNQTAVGGSGFTRVWQGWSADHNFVLIGDGYDVWALNLRGGRPINLTVDGKEHRRTYLRTTLEFPGETFEGLSALENGIADLSAPMLFSFQERRGPTGLAQRSPSTGAVTVLHTADAALNYLRASHSDTIVLRESTSVARDRYFIADRDFGPGSALFDVNEINSTPVTPGIYLTYNSSRGAPLSATLYPPFNYRPGRPYPTVVWIYERQGRANSFRDRRSLFNFLLSNGYAVLTPDIIQRVNEPGEATMEGITAGVQAAVSTGIVDENHMAVMGHSMGAWGTYYVATHSDMFRGAIPIAGVVDQVSRYGSQYDDYYQWTHYRGNGQPYLAGGWWENWNQYILNSPLFSAQDLRTPLLIIHGDQDRATPFENAFEMFGTLHAMGDRPVVLLQYIGGTHNTVQPVPDNPTGRDVTNRILQFLDHVLRDAPAPDWWSDGLSVPPGNGAAPIARDGVSQTQ